MNLRRMEVNRNRVIFGLVAALAIVVGGVYAANNVYACGSCPAHAQKANATEAKAADAKTMKAGGSCCPSEAKTASAKGHCTDEAKTASAKGHCTDEAKQATVRTASAKGSCGSSAKGQCMIDGKKTAELMDGEATLAKLSHCGVNINATSTEKLAAKLADGGCGTYTAAQWATMIESAKKLDAEVTEAVMANVKSEKACSSDECPMSLVAKDLATADSKKN